MSIKIRNIYKRFGDFVALDNVHLDIGAGELLALLGPSGCGKTTLLRIIAGLETPDQGQVHFSDQDATALHARERKVGFVFQHYALFRHMTVFENVAFGLRVKPRSQRKTAAQIAAKVHELLNLVQLDWLADRYPAQLSGGQRQRIALARALAVEPSVLLLDEPFGALDAKVRKELRRWLRHLHDELHVTSIFVTHDQEEALEVADRVVLLNRGKIEQVGTPNHVWEQPASAFVYGFLGDINVFHSRVHQGEVHLGELRFPAPEHEGASDRAALTYVRPEDIEIVIQAQAPTPHTGPQEDAGLALPAVVERILRIGALARIELQLQPGEGAVTAANPQQPVEVRMPLKELDALQLTTGRAVWLRPRKLRSFVQPTAAAAASSRARPDAQAAAGLAHLGENI